MVGLRQGQREAHEAAPRNVDAAQVQLQVQELAQLGRRLRQIGRPPDRPALRMEAQHRSLPQHLDRRAMLAGHRVEPRAQPVAARVQPLGGFGRIHLLEPGDAGRHRQHIVVVGSRVRQPVGRAWDRAAASVRACRRTRRSSRRRPDTCRRPRDRAARRACRAGRPAQDARSSPRRTRARCRAGRLLAQRSQKCRLGRDAAPAAHQRLDDDGGEALRVLATSRRTPSASL